MFVGTKLDHQLHLLSQGESTAELNLAEEFWREMFPNQVFIPDHSTIDADIKYHSKCKYNLQAASARQLSFYYQVSLPHYLDDKFIHNALERYKQFVSLKKLYPSEALVPMYDIDLMWHTHQLCPDAYWKDTELFLGKALHHDDSTNERSPNSKRNMAENKTKTLWAKEYRTTMVIPGTVYRGEDPRRRLYNFDQIDYDAQTRHKLVVRIETIEMKCKGGFSNSFEASMGINSGSEIICDGRFIGKSHQLVKGTYTWDKDSKLVEVNKLPLNLSAEPDKKYKMKLKIIRRGRLKGLLPRKEYFK